LEDLSAEFSVVAWDAPGCGGSSDPPEGFRMADYADCLAEFIEDLGLDRLHVLGHSFGGDWPWRCTDATPGSSRR